MSQTPTDDQRWQQPSWESQPPYSADEQDPLTSSGGLSAPLSGAVILPSTSVKPPSVLESSLNVLGAVTWPAAIALALFGVGGWLVNIVLAIVISGALSAIASEMKKHRKHQ